MKNFMSPRTGVLREHIAAETQSSPSPNPKHKSSSSSRKHKITKENADPNPDPCSASKAKMKSPLPPRPPSSNANPLKRKLCLETLPENALPGFSDSGVKVIVRMRPPMKEDESDMIVKKVTNDSLSILDHDFTFDAVADTESTQKDIFQVVGAPLIENCLAGFNSSIFAYGQTGSGKTYTMWGPANLSLDEILSSNQKGLTPHVFEKLYERIAEEQVKHADKQLQYHCRCSFLEIYNEQITDLLDPTQGNLQIREDVKSGVYVENLTEEYVGTVKDVIHLLVKGLSNRRTGATSINAESSRSHCVFTCAVESRCKSTADGLSSIRISRINLVDLAGSERQKLTGAAGERLKEAGNINRSLSQLGNLINILADVSQSGKQRHIPYRDSKLTFLLQESLGGNAKLAMICAVSPTQSCKSETLSTLRFAQRAKAVKNKAIVNEVMQEDVKVLREVIRQLKDELLKMKENGNPNANGGYSTSWNARRSLNLLKMSLNRPMTLPHIEEDSDDEMEIVEEAVERLGVQVGLQPVVHEKDSVSDGINLQQHVKSDTEVVSQESKNTSLKMPHFDEETILMRQKSLDPSQSACFSDELSDRTYVTREGSKLEVVSQNADEHGLDIDSCVVRSIDVPSSSISDGHSHQYLEENNDTEGHLVLKNSDLPDVSSAGDHIKDNLTMTDLSGRGSAIVSLVDKPSDLVDGGSEVVSPLLTVSVSPTISNSSRKSLKISSMLSASQKDVNLSFAKPLGSNPSNEHLAISLHHGLQVIDSHHRNNSILRRSSFRFSYKPVDLKVAPVEKVDVGVQTLPQVSGEPGEDSSGFLCSKCKSRIDHIEYSQANDNCNMQLVPFDGSQSPEKSKKMVPKAVENVLAGAIRREMALEEFCSKQTSEIMQLNRLIMQYKHERECNDIIAQTREDKIVRLESLMDGVLPTEEFMEEELVSLTNEHKLLKEKYENHPEVLRAKIDLKRVQDELDSYRSFFDMGERDVLIEEIQNLRSQLQYYIDSPSPMSARKRSQLLQLTHTSEPSPAPLSVIPEYTEESVADKFEQERQHWIESESNWISLSEELKNELEASRSLAVKQKKELDLEKKCSEELKEALQMAMQGHARLLEQYCDLQEKHMEMLARNRKMQEGIEDVKRAAAKAGVKGAESRFINSLAAEISALRVEREKERRYFTDENKGLQAQLRDTAEAVQAAGELLVRLKEAEEAACAAQRRASEAEQEVQRVHEQINISKGNHQNICPECHKASNNQKWQDEFEPSYKEVDGTDPSWFTGYDRCNI